MLNWVHCTAPDYIRSKSITLIFILIYLLCIEESKEKKLWKTGKLFSNLSKNVFLVYKLMASYNTTKGIVKM